MLTEFYAVAAAACFTLLGLWWVVLQFKYDAWMRDPARRRLAYDVSLYFLLPGVMSLVSLLAIRVTYLWRVGFGLAGAIGVVELIASARALPASLVRRSLIGVLRWGAVALYVLVVVLAIDPTLPSAAGVGLKGLEIEGLMISLLMFMGVNFAWLVFAEATEATEATVPAP